MLPPTSAGSGGGSGTLDVDGAAVVLDADAVVEFGTVEFGTVEFGAVEFGAVEFGAAGVDAVGLDTALPDVVLAGACGLLKSVHDCVRNVSPLALTLSAVLVTV